MDATYEIPVELLEADYNPADLLAENIPFDRYLEQFMGHHTEWLEGRVYQMAAVTKKHNDLTMFLQTLLGYFLRQTESGALQGDPFAMKLSENYSPQPDLMVITTPNLSRLLETYLDGAADLVVEITSQGTNHIDRGFKFNQYETFGVREYWIIDPLRREALFYVLDEDGLYQRQNPTSDGVYLSVVLPKFHLAVNLLFQDVLPHAGECVAMVQQMLSEEN